MNASQARNAVMVAIDTNHGFDMLWNAADSAWRGITVPDGRPGKTIVWRRAREGETSRDGLWVVGGGQWRYGC